MEELRNSQSYIDAYAKYIKTGKDKEIRALLTANAIALEGTTQIPVPEFVYDTVKTAWEDSELLRYVRKLYVKGNLKVGFEISSSGAEIHSEGGDPIQEEQLQIGVVELVPEMIKKYVMLSDELEAMASRDFLIYVYDELTHQIALKLETEIINAITNQPVGVTVPEVVNYGANPKPETIAMSLSRLCAEAKNPVAIMNRGTWGEFKKAQYEANYPIDVFEKLTVIFSDALKSFADASVNEPYLIVGDFENGFLMNYPEGDEIRIKRDDITLATQDLVRYVGRVYCAMGVIAPRHFVTVNKGNEATPIVPTGNIEITENTAEPLDISQYATATVNVSGGGGDFKYCEVTIVCPTEGTVTGLTPANAEGVMNHGFFRVNNGDKIKCYYTLDEGEIMALLAPQNDNAVFEVSDHVNCEPIEEGSPYVIITNPTENSSFTLTVTNWGGGF